MSIYYDKLRSVFVLDEGVAVSNKRAVNLDFSGFNVTFDEATGTAKITADTLSSLPQVHQNKFIGRFSAGLGAAEEVALGSEFGFVAGALKLIAGGVALVALAAIADQTILGNASGAVASPTALSPNQVISILPSFGASGTSHARGLVPDPGGIVGSTRFLCENGAWATVGGAFASPATPADDNKIAYANSGGVGWRAGITTPIPNGFAFLAETTNSNVKLEHGTIFIRAKDSTGAQYGSLVRWGIANDELKIGGGGSFDMAVMRCTGRPGVQYLWEEVTGVNIKTLTSQGMSFSGVATTGTVAPAFKVTDAAHTALTAATERSSVVFDLSQTRQWATGALTNQRSFRILAPTLGFVGASTVSIAATFAITGAPTAGSNATLSNPLAAWIEAGGLGFGANPSADVNAYIRTSNNFTIVSTRAVNTTTNLQILKVDGSDNLVLGDVNVAGEFHQVKATTGFYNFRLGSTSFALLDATGLNLQSNPLYGVATLNGSVISFALAGTNLTNADQTLTVAGGGRYVSSVTLTANRKKILGTSGSPLTNQVIRIERKETSAFTITIRDSADANTLFVFPSGQLWAADFIFNGTDWEAAGNIPLAA